MITILVCYRYPVGIQGYTQGNPPTPGSWRQFTVNGPQNVKLIQPLCRYLQRGQDVRWPTYDPKDERNTGQYPRSEEQVSSAQPHQTTPAEDQLIALYRQITPAQQAAITAMLAAMLPPPAPVPVPPTPVSDPPDATTIPGLLQSLLVGLPAMPQT